MYGYVMISANTGAKEFDNNNIVLLDMETMKLVTMKARQVKEKAKAGVVKNGMCIGSMLKVLKPIYTDRREGMAIGIDVLRGNTEDTSVAIARIKRGMYVFATRVGLGENDKCDEAITITKLGNYKFAIKLEIKAEVPGQSLIALEKYFNAVGSVQNEYTMKFINEAINVEWVKKLNSKRAMIGVEQYDIVSYGEEVIMFHRNWDISKLSDVEVPEGVTILSGAGMFCNELMLPSSLKCIECTIKASKIHGFRQDIYVNEYCNVIGRKSEAIENNGILVMPKKLRVNKGVYRNIYVERVLYYEPESASLCDKSFGYNDSVKELGIVANSKIQIRKEQFKRMGKLERIITPKGKIEDIGDMGLYECENLKEIDLTECRRLGRSAMTLDTKKGDKRIIVRFNRNIELCRESLLNKVKAVIFNCDDVQIDGNVFGEDVLLICNRDKVYRYLMSRKCLANSNITIRLSSDI